MSDKPVYTLTVDLPDLPEGELVQIPGLGTFENAGDPVDVTKQQADAYRVYHQRQETVTDEESGAILGSELVLGPTLLEASKSMYGVEVKTAGSSSSSSSGSSSSSSSSSDDSTEGGDK